MKEYIVEVDIRIMAHDETEAEEKVSDILKDSEIISHTIHNSEEP